MNFCVVQHSASDTDAHTGNMTAAVSLHYEIHYATKV